MPETLTNTVVVYGLGGTIAMSSAPSGGVVPALSAAQLLATIPALNDAGVRIEAVDFRRLPGASLTFDDLDALIARIRTTLAAGAAGVVVVQGTDTIEETAFHLGLRHVQRQPVVVTGAMRNPTMPGADGPANLLAAVTTAAHPASRDQGVLVVFNDEIHTAARVCKTHSTSVATFQSPNGGPLGYLVEGAPRYVNRARPRLTVPAPRPGVAPRIGLHTATLGDDPALLDGIAHRIDGLVVAAMGVGHVPQPLVEPLTKIAEAIPVVLTSRTSAGAALTSTYAFPGSERDLISRGLISAGYLDPLKARLLLRALIAAGASTVEVRQAFAVAGGTADGLTWPWPPNSVEDRHEEP